MPEYARTVRTSAALVSAALFGCLGFANAADVPVARWQGRTMGSPYTVQVVGLAPEAPQVTNLQARIEATLKEVNRQMSHYDPQSELSRFNVSPADAPYPVSPDFAQVMRFTLALSQQTDGALDPTLAPIINLWGFGERSTNRAVPAEPDIQAALAHVGYKHLAVTPGNELVKRIPQLTINLSAVAKGFGVDRMIEVLHQNGRTNVFAAIAGEVRVTGHNSRGTPWQIGISEPVSHWQESDPMAGVVSLSNQAISTSGDYQKFFLEDKGRRLAHIFDARTGWPVQHNVGGVSVVATNSMTADALSTALFVMGLPDGMRFIEEMTNASALFIVREPDGRFRQVKSTRFPPLSTLPK
jgi:thiamine biosynthesis lipoprotein